MQSEIILKEGKNITYFDQLNEYINGLARFGGEYQVQIYDATKLKELPTKEIERLKREIQLARNATKD